MAEAGLPEVDEADLFAVAPDHFVVARDGLVRRLRAGGDKAGAARVAKLRRPPPTTWALNQVSRNTPALIEQLLDAGSVLRSAMEKALRGDASALRQARADERRAVDAIVDEARRRLHEGGNVASDVMNRRMADTLRAAIVDDTVADLLRQGILDRDRQAPGFGMDALAAPLTLVPPAAHEAARGNTTAQGGTAAEAEAEAEAARARRQAATEEADRLAAEAQHLVAEADRLDRQADRLAAEAKAARDEADEVRARAAAATAAAQAQRAVADHLAAPRPTSTPASA